MIKVLTIAGSDSIGGAGIQADIKTITAHKAYAMSVVTALTAQNTLGVQGVHEAPPEFVGRQLDSVFGDIIPDAVKIGMVSSAAIIEVIAEKLERYRAKNIVLDPVMVATSGGKLLGDGAADALVTKLFPLADIVTPNIPEAEVLSGAAIRGPEDMLAAARKIPASRVLVKGGHLAGFTSDDLLCQGGGAVWIRGERIEIRNPRGAHGTGCTLSSAIACNLARGYDMERSAREAKEYVAAALRSAPEPGKGAALLRHF